MRVRIQRVLEAQTAEAYGKLWTGDVWEVSISDLSTGERWVVGRQLLASTFTGISKIASFFEHIGCTFCDSFDASASRGGPWVLHPEGVELISASSKYGNKLSDGFTCLNHGISSDVAGLFTYTSGPSVPAHAKDDGTWDKLLYSCPYGGCPPPKLDIKACCCKLREKEDKEKASMQPSKE